MGTLRFAHPTSSSSAIFVGWTKAHAHQAIEVGWAKERAHNTNIRHSLLAIEQD
jgi:hypothetical protein